MQECSSLTGWLAQATVVCVGWIVVHVLSSARDMEKSRRELISKAAESMSESLTDLLSLSKEYHLNERNKPTEVKIKILIQDINAYTFGLAEVCDTPRHLNQCKSDLSRIRRTITGTHFEDEHTGPITEQDPQVQEIGELILKAKRSFLELKLHQFSKNKKSVQSTSA